MNGTYYIEIAKSRSLNGDSLMAESRAHKAIGDKDRAVFYENLAKDSYACAQSYFDMAKNCEDDSSDEQG